jgi:hypothetical protein
VQSVWQIEKASREKCVFIVSVDLELSCKHRLSLRCLVKEAATRPPQFPGRHYAIARGQLSFGSEMRGASPVFEGALQGHQPPSLGGVLSSMLDPCWLRRAYPEGTVFVFILNESHAESLLPISHNLQMRHVWPILHSPQRHGQQTLLMAGLWP